MNAILQDVRFALRLLAKSPGFTSVVVLTLGLCIGLNTAIFSIVNAMLYFTLPFPEPDRLVRIHRTSPHAQDWPHSIGNFLDLREQNGVFDNLSAFFFDEPSLSGGDGLPETLLAMRVSAEFFTALGVKPLLGRAFLPGEDQPGRCDVVLLREGLWRRRFGGDAAVVGRVIRLDGRSVTVVGVMSELMTHFQMWGRIDVWRPIEFSPDRREERGANFLHMLGRLKPGISLAQAQAHMSALVTRINEEHPTSFNARENVRLERLGDSFGSPVDASRCYALLAIAGFVLLIGCVNVANLLLARGAGRVREMAIRTAVGAGRGRLLRQLLTESLLLAALGSALGLAMAAWGIDGLTDFINGRIAAVNKVGVEFPIDGRVLGYALAITALTGIFFGLVPALYVSRTDVHHALKEGGATVSSGRSTRLLRTWLIASEVAITLVLLVGCGLLGRSTLKLLRLDPGYRTDHRLLMVLNLPRKEPYSERAGRENFYRQALERLAALPGVEVAGLTTALPVWPPGGSRFFTIQGRPQPAGQTMLAHTEMVTPGLFALLGMQVKAGRDFAEEDTRDAPPVAIVNETMARKFWPGESPIGARVSTGHSPPRDWAEIVGVVSDAKSAASTHPDETLARLYTPFWQDGGSWAWLALRTTVEPESLSEAVRRTVAALDPGLPVSRMASMETIVGAEMIDHEIIVYLLGGFASLGLLLAAIGVYGVIAHSVSQRTHEIGIRLALGAQRREVLVLLVRQGMIAVAVGLAIGLAGAFALAHVMRGVLYGITARDPSTLLAAISVLVAAAAIACYLPARRAVRIEPMAALRIE